MHTFGSNEAEFYAYYALRYIFPDTQPLYRSPGKKPKSVGCRFAYYSYVVCNGRAKDESYKPSADDRQYHISGSQGHLSTIQAGLDYQLSLTKELLELHQDPNQRRDYWYQYDKPENVSPPTAKDRLQLQKVQGLINQNISVAQVLRDIQDRKERQIGHLAYYPDFSISTRPTTAWVSQRLGTRGARCSKVHPTSGQQNLS
ncbi:hypothetical protein F4777DRAFT_580971 [Nemania sp. FL0916]|nr:hypothetical protein F4777DRAFT_580971 [Nemania sp. FL0916]